MNTFHEYDLDVSLIDALVSRASDDLSERDLRFYLFSHQKSASVSLGQYHGRTRRELIKMLEDYLRTSGHKGHSFTCRGSPQACPKLFLRLFFSRFLRLVVVNVPLFFSYPLFTFNIDGLSPISFSIPIYVSFAVLFSLLTMLLPLAKYIVERDRVSNQEIALVSSKLSAPEKIEVALIKKREKRRREALGASRELAFLPWPLYLSS